jgi:hypothetical protein
MDQSTIEKWKNKDLWSEKELQELCCGLEPNGARPNTDELNAAGEAIMRAVLSGVLPCICPSDATAGDKMYGHGRFFRPVDAIEWAAQKFSKFQFLPTGLVTKPNQASVSPTPTLNSQVFAKLLTAIETFDPHSPPRSKKAFMGELEGLGCDTREQEVFANIAAEHFRHSWRT